MITFPKFSPPVIAHRGASAHAPENTIIAFTKAVQLGIKWIEFDVMLANCGEPIIFHDETLERTTSKCGNISDYSYAYLRSLDAGSWFDLRFAGEKIPTLKQGMEFLQNTRISANVEIKPLPGQDEKTALYALNEISKYFPQPNLSILFSSFSIESLKCLRKHSPSCYLGLLLHEWETGWQDHCDMLQCISVHVNEEILTPESAKIIKSMDKLLLCYTVNDPKRAIELYSWGVDAVFSDVPDKILMALQETVKE